MDTKPLHDVASNLRRLAVEFEELATSMDLAESEDEAEVLIEEWSSEALERGNGPLMALALMSEGGTLRARAGVELDVREMLTWQRPA